MGAQGETCPIDRKKLERSYEVLDGPFAFDPTFVTERFYPPAVMGNLSPRLKSP